MKSNLMCHITNLKYRMVSIVANADTLLAKITGEENP